VWARAERLHGGADPVGIFRRNRDDCAVDLDTLLGDRGGDKPERLGGDAGDSGELEIRFAEFLQSSDEPVGTEAADADVLWTELLPG
jgi:hypothetical protein